MLVIKLRETIMILDLHQQGLTVSAISRETGIDRKTVRKYIERGLEAPAYGPRKPRATVIDPFASYLRDRVKTYPGLTGSRLLRELRERGYTGGYTAVTDFLRDVRPVANHGFEVRFETPPGEQAQVDFAQFHVVFTDEPMTPRIVWLFSMVQGHSRLIWARFEGMQQRFAGTLCFAAKRRDDSTMIIIATNCEPNGALAAYKRRWQIECLFGDTKTRGLNMEDTKLTQPAKLSLLMAVVALALAWAHACASATKGHANIARASHGYRRKSWFRTGFDALRHWIASHPDRASDLWRSIWNRPKPNLSTCGESCSVNPHEFFRLAAFRLKRSHHPYDDWIVGNFLIAAVVKLECGHSVRTNRHGAKIANFVPFDARVT